MKYIILFIFISISFCTFGQKAVHISNVAHTVSDTKAAVDFFTKTVNATAKPAIKLEGENLQKLFGIRDEKLTLQITPVFIGNEEIQLLEFKSSKQGKEIPEDSKSNDLWFQHIAIVVKDMDKAYKRVADLKVKHVSTAPQVLPDYIPEAAGISAFYFRDKDDHNFELIYFPEGKGNPKWKKESSNSFLGIDHTAIGISDTDEGIKFYQDLLGLTVGGNSENYGTEQEHLNQVFGARLLITGLHAEKGFGVEFLQYIAPPGGRLYPENTSAIDHWYWHTAMEVDNLEALTNKIKENNYKIVSSGIQSIPELSYAKALIVKDFDGHAILLYEKNN